MNRSCLRADVDGRGVATLTLSRPEKRNALDAALIDSLARAASFLGSDSQVRAIVLTGEGNHFCAGGDLEWMREQFSASREERMREARRFAHMLRALNEIPKPLIGRVNGSAYGGGLGLMSVCDSAIAAEGASFCFPEARLGLIPATIGPYCLARMGEGKARRVFFTARAFGAEEAVSLGLAAQAVPPERLDEAVEAQIAPALLASPEAVASAKRFARSLGPVIDDSVIEASVERLADAWESRDAVEGVSAFLEKRKPEWGGGGS